jgi:ribosomal protein L13E
VQTGGGRGRTEWGRSNGGVCEDLYSVLGIQIEIRKERREERSVERREERLENR